MKTFFKTVAIGGVVILTAMADTAMARPPTGPVTKPLGPIPADPTKYDCRVTTAVRYVTAKGRQVKLWEVKECPHKDKMAAGQCEKSFWFGMRCKN